MKSLINKIVMMSILLLVSISGFTQQEKGGFTHKIVVGYHLGGTTPIPLPREIRSVDSYWPQFTPQFGYNISYQLYEKLSIESGATLDWKGMGVRDKVKYMYTNVTMDQKNTEGYFTGRNETKVKISYITVPLRVAYDLTPTWKLRGGGYVSYRNSSEFSGSVWDGYLIETTKEQGIINGRRIDIPFKGDATFDFGKEMRDFDMGVSLGFEHEFQSRFGIYGDITYSLTPIFPSSFTGIDVKMRNVYGIIGVSYRL